jgi:chemotaxis protein methyltransferase CheR
MNDPVFATIARHIRDVTGLALGQDQAYLLSARLAPVLRRRGLGDMGELARRLGTAEGRGLLQEAAEATTTNETSFFRDDAPFRHLGEKVLPALAAARPPGAPIRVWSAACSSGQEAYSVAMLAAGARAPGPWRIELLGTDFSTAMVQRAREGVFTQFEIQRGLPSHLLARWFRQEGDRWRVAEELRAACRFQELNLLGDLSSLGRFDVIMLRNVLIYFDTPTKERVLEGCIRHLAPDGVLYLGAAETLLGLRSSLVPLTEHRGAFVLPQPGRG